MRKLLLLTVAICTLLGCDSASEPEAPKLKTGANAELAIELPLIFPPEPRRAQIITEWSVLQNLAIWFRNVEEDPIELSMWVTDPRTGDTDRVGYYTLAPFTTKPMGLNDAFVTNAYRDLSWTLQYRANPVIETIVVGFAD